MPKDNSFHEYVMSEVFTDIEGVASRAMFGGYGIYEDGVFFALISDGELYFKVDGSNQSDYEKRGSKPFIYSGRKGKSITMSYWQLPEEIMENRQDLVIWIHKSVSAARNSKKK